MPVKPADDVWGFKLSFFRLSKNVNFGTSVENTFGCFYLQFQRLSEHLALRQSRNFTKVSWKNTPRSNECEKKCQISVSVGILTKMSGNGKRETSPAVTPYYSSSTAGKCSTSHCFCAAARRKAKKWCRWSPETTSEASNCHFSDCLKNSIFWTLV